MPLIHVLVLLLSKVEKDKVEMKRNNTNIKTINMSELNYLAINELSHKASDSFNKITITPLIANTK